MMSPKPPSQEGEQYYALDWLTSVLVGQGKEPLVLHLVGSETFSST